MMHMTTYPHKRLNRWTVALQAYLRRFQNNNPGMVMHELGRIILAGGDQSHRRAEAQQPGYMNWHLAELARVLQSQQTYGHLLTHGHLGYYHVFKVPNNDFEASVGQLKRRGMFKLSDELQQWLNSVQEIYLKYFSFVNSAYCNMHLMPMTSVQLPNDLISIEPEQVSLDSNGVIVNATRPYQFSKLRQKVDNLVMRLFDSDSVDSVKFPARSTRTGTFLMDITYKERVEGGGEHLKPIGIDSLGNEVDTVRFMILVEIGLVSVVSMYPLDE